MTPDFSHYRNVYTLKSALYQISCEPLYVALLDGVRFDSGVWKKLVVLLLVWHSGRNHFAETVTKSIRRNKNCRRKKNSIALVVYSEIQLVTARMRHSEFRTDLNNYILISSV